MEIREKLIAVSAGKGIEMNRLLKIIAKKQRDKIEELQRVLREVCEDRIWILEDEIDDLTSAHADPGDAEWLTKDLNDQIGHFKAILEKYCLEREEG